MSKRVIILILSIDIEPFKNLERAIRETWYNLNEPQVPIFFYYGNSKKNQIIGDQIFTDALESDMGHKTLKTFEMIYDNFDFDYIFRTNLSSYVDINNMIEFLKNKPKKEFYSGIIGMDYGILFCSGSGYFLSRDLVEKTIQNKHNWDHSKFDDVSLGKLMFDFGIKITVGKRYDFGYGKILSSEDSHMEFVPMEPSSALDFYHYRCKTNDGSRRACIENMSIIYNLKKNN